MNYHIITVQFAVPDYDPNYRLTTLRDEIQEILYDEHGMNGSFRIVGAIHRHDNGDESGMFDQAPFDPATITNNATDLIQQERAITNALHYHVDGVMPDDTLGPDEEARAPFTIFDIVGQTYIPGDFESRPDAEAQAERMNKAVRARNLEKLP